MGGPKNEIFSKAIDLLTVQEVRWLGRSIIEKDCRIKIFWLQKKVIRLITGVRKRESCRPIFRKFQILTLASLYIFEMLCFLKKASRECETKLRNTWT